MLMMEVKPEVTGGHRLLITINTKDRNKKADIMLISKDHVYA